VARQNRQNKLGSQRHEWRTSDEEGRIINYRAIHHGTEWRFIWSFKVGRSEEIAWNEVEEVSREMWETLRDILWRKYQRRRVPFEFIDAIDKKLAQELED
jgi:hypothetical protein